MKARYLSALLYITPLEAWVESVDGIHLSEQLDATHSSPPGTASTRWTTFWPIRP